ncbi:MAG TPA: hypothetical protein VGN82_08080 [Bosea sp. (in: a-proteobacteria)]|uniref:hypothetical protein n=1 Tax=Bosea sp. (in: a-proteobacteria) TaxID=1871050 RepID=UPI002E11C148|nr:hypothetical protein [Bosea sp. (in: a-proteobacteria)]
MSKPRLPTVDTSLRDYPYVVIRFRCHVCERGGDARLAVLAAKYGSDALLGRLLRVFIGGCPWDPHNPARKPQKYGHRCGGYCPDLLSPRPPDLPPSMTGLTVIDGGKSEMLPAEPKREERRRRVGREDE